MSALKIIDLENGKRDLEHIEALATSNALTAIDRAGNVKPTTRGAVVALSAAKDTAVASIANKVAEVEVAKEAAVASIPARIATLGAFNSRGDWSTATVYAVKDLAKSSGVWYACLVAHTAGGSFSTDFAAGKWSIHQGLTSAEMAASDGATKVGIMQAFSGAAARDVRAKTSDFIVVDDAGGSDDTAKAITALAGVLPVYFLGRDYEVEDKLPLQTKQTVQLSGTTKVKQLEPNLPIFEAVNQDQVYLHGHGAILEGEGSYIGSGLGAFTGMSSSNDKVVTFKGCTNFGASYLDIRNGASAGLAVIGGRGGRFFMISAQGTHLFDAPIEAGGNNQAAFYVSHDATYGAAKDMHFLGIDISYTAQGFLVELQPGAPLPDLSMLISSVTGHNIIGQHLFYIQAGMVAISGVSARKINLSAVKVQAADADVDIHGVSALGVVGSEVGNALFEIAGIGAGYNSLLRLSGSVDTGRIGIGVRGKVRDLRADITVANLTDNGYLLQDSGLDDIEIKIAGRSIGKDGGLVTAPSGRIKVWPTLRECNSASTEGTPTNYSALRSNSSGALVEYFDPDVTDADGKQQYGLFNEGAGTVKVHGTATLTGAREYAVRTNGPITEFPSDATLQGTTGDFLGITKISSSKAMRVRLTTTTATAQVLWGRTLADNTALTLRVLVKGKKSDGSQRKSVIMTADVYRSAGGDATIQAQASDVISASGSFTGVYAWYVTGTEIYLRVNSGENSTYLWTAKLLDAETV